MLGYVTVYKDELKMREFDIYRGYYCGVCKSIASRHGTLPRLVLSYDSVFLAMLLASLEEGQDSLSSEHCILHHIRKNPVVRGKAVDYAADMLVILAYHKLLDDRRDEHKIRGAAGELAFRRVYAALEKQYPDICAEVKAGIDKLSKLEAERSPSLDLTAEAFAGSLKAVFCGYFSDPAVNRILAEAAGSLGRWIYIADAMSDLEDDRRNGCYNPLIYREGGAEGLEDTLYHHLGQLSASLDLLDIRKNKGIIENVVLLGLRGRTDTLLQKGE